MSVDYKYSWTFEEINLKNMALLFPFENMNTNTDTKRKCPLRGFRNRTRMGFEERTLFKHRTFNKYQLDKCLGVDPATFNKYQLDN